MSLRLNWRPKHLLVLLVILLALGLAWLAPRNEVIFISPSNAEFALERVLDEINSAKFSINVAAYMLTNRSIINALQSKRNQGVKVRIYYGELSEMGGIRVPGLHMKLIVIDGITAIIGSANFTEAAFGQNQEVIVITRSGEFNKWFEGR